MNCYQQVMFKSAKDLISKRQYEEALKILIKLNSELPDNTIINLSLARILVKNEETKQEGKKIFFHLLNCENERTKTYALLELGRLSANDGNILEAQKYFDQSSNTKFLDGKEYSYLEIGKLNLFEGNINMSRQQFEQLLDTKSKTKALLKLGKLEFSIGNIPLARKYFDRILGSQNEKDKIYALLELAFIEIHQYNYMEALKNIEKLLAKKNKIVDKSLISEIEKVKYFLCYKLGILSKKDILEKSKNNYFFRQLFSYDRDNAIAHIKNHLDCEDKIEGLIFDVSVNIENLYDSVISIFDYIDPKSITLSDKYIIECNDVIGKVDNYETKNIEVVTFSNSQNIITMYPTLEKPFYNQQADKIKTDRFVIDVEKIKNYKIISR